MLHQDSQTSPSNKPIGLASNGGNLLIDFMLSTSEATLGEIYTVYLYVSQKEKRSLKYIKHNEFSKATTER